MNNTSAFHTWKLARQGMRTHWLVGVGASAVLLAILAGLYLAGIGILPVFVTMSYIHGMVVSYFTLDCFFEKKVPLLPGRKNKGIIFILTEWALNLICVFSVGLAVAAYDSTLFLFTLSSCLSLMFSWWFGWVAFHLLLRMKLWVFLVMLLGILLPNNSNFWITPKLLLIMSASVMLGVNIKRISANQSTSGTQSKFARKSIKRAYVGWLNPLRIRAEFMIRPSWGQVIRLAFLELGINGLGFGAAYGIMLLITYFRSFQFEVPLQYAGIVGLIFARFFTKAVMMFSLENGLPCLPGISRSSWCRKSSAFNEIDWSISIASMLLFIGLIDMTSSFLTDGHFWFSSAFKYLVLGTLCWVALACLILMILAADLNRAVFSGSFRMPLNERKKHRKKISKKVIMLIAALFSLIVTFITGIAFTAMHHPELLKRLAQPRFLGLWAMGLLLIIILSRWTERRWTLRAFQHGDLV